MPNAHCPMCRFAFPAEGGGRVECPKCYEVFDPAVPPKPVAKAVAPIPLADVVEDEDIPVVRPVSPSATPTRPVAKAVAPAAPTPPKPKPAATAPPKPQPAPPPKPPKPTPQERKTVGAPRVTRRDDDDDDKPRRPAAMSGWKLIAGGAVGLLAIIGVAVGVGYFGRDVNKPPAVAAAPPPSTQTRPMTGVPVEPEPVRVVPPPFFPPAEPPPFVAPPPPFQPKPEPPKPPAVRVTPPAEVVEITPTAATDGAVVNLPSAADKVCVGGGGRFLIFRIPKERQLAVFDATFGKIAKFLPLAEEGGLIAAGMTKLYVVLPGANMIQRWNLLTFEKELTVQNPLGGKPLTAVMGHLTDGPLFMGGPGVGGAQNGFGPGVGFLDTTNMTATGVPAGGPRWWDTHPPAVRVSADGRVYAWCTPSLSPNGLASMILTDSTAKVQSKHESAGTLFPGPDGTIYAGPNVFTSDLVPVSGPKELGGAAKGFVLPAVQGPFYLEATAAGDPFRDGRNTTVKLNLSVKMAGESRPLVSLGSPEGFATTSEFGFNVYFAGPQLAERVFLIPSAELLVVVGPTGDKLYLHSFNLKDKLDKSDIDYLLVMSRPHAARTGKNYRYVPDVLSKKGGVKIKLDAGPDGMKVVGNSVTWKVPADFTGVVDVILTVSDASGQEAFHAFKLPVSDQGPDTPEPIRPMTTAAVTPTPAVPAPAKDTPPEPAEIAAAPKPRTPPKLTTALKELNLPGSFDAVCSAGGGHLLLLRLPQSRQIAVFDAREAAVVKYLPLIEGDALIAGGRDHAYVYAPAASVIQRWNLISFKKELTVASPVTWKVEKFLHGADSTGPLILGGGERFRSAVAVLDTRTMKESNRKFPTGGHSGLSGAAIVRISGDGKLVTAYNPGSSPMGHTAYTTAGDDYKASEVGEWGDIYGHAVPAPDGKNIFTSHGVFTAEGKHSLTSGKGKGGRGSGYFYTLPAAEPVPVFLSVTSAGFPHGDGASGKLFLHLPNERTPVTELSQVTLPTGINVWDREPIGTDQRVQLIPSADAVVVLPETNDRLVMHRVNLKQTLDRSGKNYLYVTSSPPPAEHGKVYRYVPEVQSKSGGVKIKLDAGPDGMKVVGNVVVAWVAPAGGPNRVNVLLSVSDASGQEIFHAFELPVVSSIAAAADPDPDPGMKTDPPEPVPMAKAPPAPTAKPAPPVSVLPPVWTGETVSIALPAKATDMIVGGGGRFLLLPLANGKSIEVIDVTAGKVVTSIPMTEPGPLVAAGGRTAVVYFPTAKQIQLWDLDTMTRTRVAPAPAELTEYAPTSFVMGSASDGPVFFHHRTPKVTAALDPKTLAVTEVEWKHWGPNRAWGPTTLEVSANGAVLLGGGGGWAGTGVARVRNGKVVSTHEDAHRDLWRVHDGPGFPTHDGGLILTSGGAIPPSLTGKPVNSGMTLTGEVTSRLVPTGSPDFYLRVSPVRIVRTNARPKDGPPATPANVTLTLFTSAGHKVCTLSGYKELARAAVPTSDPLDQPDDAVRPRLGSTRYQFHPAARVLVTLTPDDRSVVLRRVDLEKELKAERGPYLLVSSAPPPAVAGQSFAYTPTVHSSSGGVELSLTTGPKGMKVDGGAVKWDVPAGFAEKSVNVILTVTDGAKKETFHTFELPVLPPK